MTRFKTFQDEYSGDWVVEMVWSEGTCVWANHGDDKLGAYKDAAYMNRLEREPSDPEPPATDEVAWCGVPLCC